MPREREREREESWFYKKLSKDDRRVIKGWVIGCGLLLLCLNFAMLAVILGFTANWQANGISANVKGDVTCAPLMAGESFMSSEVQVQAGTETEVPVQSDDRSAFCMKELCMNADAEEACVPSEQYKDYDCCMNETC